MRFTLMSSHRQQHIPQLLVLSISSGQNPEMSDFQGPIIVSPPPSPSSSDKSNRSMLYYGLAVVGIAVMTLALYNLMIIKRSRRRRMQSQAEGSNEVVVMESSIDHNNLLTSVKYTKREAGKEGFGDDYECPVCLSGFEEGDEVRKLVECKHWFHAPCIDMWLYSHFDCPICRTPVSPFCDEHHNSGYGAALFL